MLQNKHARSKWYQGALIILLVLILVSGCSSKGKGTGKDGGKDVKPPEVTETGKAVAIYEDGEISQAEFDSFIGVTLFFNPQYVQFTADPSFMDAMLNQLIAFKILYSRADEKVKGDSLPKVTEQIEQFKQFFEMQGVQLAEELQKTNLTENDIEQYVERSIVVMADMENKINNDTIKAEYERLLAENKDKFSLVTVSHILISFNDPATQEAIRTEEEALIRAEEVVDKLNKGGDFAELVAEYTNDTNSIPNGGTYADANVNQFVDEFKQAALKLPLNTVGDPVKTEFGYHVMKVEARHVQTLDEVKESLRSDMASQHIQDFMENDLPGLIQEVNLPSSIPPGELEAE